MKNLKYYLLTLCMFAASCSGVDDAAKADADRSRAETIAKFETYAASHFPDWKVTAFENTLENLGTGDTYLVSFSKGEKEKVTRLRVAKLHAADGSEVEKVFPAGGVADGRPCDGDQADEQPEPPDPW